MERAREKGVMTQMGIQISSDFSERLAVELIQMGAIGKVKEAHTFSQQEMGRHGAASAESDPVPEGFELGISGSARQRAQLHQGYYHPGNWRKRRDFGTGTLGDMGCHMFSGWFRSLGLAAPISVKSTGPAPNKDNWAINAVVEYTFKGTQYTAGDSIKVTWTDGDARPPAEVMALGWRRCRRSSPARAPSTSAPTASCCTRMAPLPMLFPRDKFTGLKYPKLEPRNHWADFIDCCLKGGDKKPTANFDYAGPLTEAVLLGCLASAFPNETAANGTPPH
jgi:hypothetical protein